MMPEVTFQQVQPEPIWYKRGATVVPLSGPAATLYRGMVWMYGEEAAADRVWSWQYKKNSVSTPENAVQTL